MKHLLTLLALIASMTAGAQTYPWNPDSNADEFIGFTDILDILAVYGAEFSPENLICNSDSSSVIIYTGQLRFPQCVKSCYELGSNWDIPSRMEFYRFDLAELQSGPSWINSKGLEAHPVLPAMSYQHVISTGYAGSGELYYVGAMGEEACYCYTEERPKVEYTFCSSTVISSFQNCCNTKTEDGWYPLPNPVDFGSQAHLYSQAFWRWAE